MSFCLRAVATSTGCGQSSKRGQRINNQLSLGLMSLSVHVTRWAGLRREIAVWSDIKQDVILLESSGDFYGMWPELEAWAANK
jgi:hypothetical protein